MSKKLTLAEKLKIIRTETITHGNEKVRVIDILEELAGMNGVGGAELSEIRQILSVDDESLDTLQEIVDRIKEENISSTLSPKLVSELKNRLIEVFRDDFFQELPHKVIRA